MRRTLFMLALACIPLVLSGFVLWVDPGGHRHGNKTPEQIRSAMPSASSMVPDVRYTLTELREALPVPTDVGAGYRTYPGGVDRKNPRSMVTERGVPVCHKSGVVIGQMEEWLFRQYRTRTPGATSNGYYLADAAYRDASAAGKAMDTIRDAVAACPPRYEQPRRAMGIGYVPRSSQTWTPEPEAVVHGWRHLRVVQLMHYPDQIGQWQDTTVRTVTDYLTRGNAVLVQQFWIWGTPKGSVEPIKARADALIAATIARLDGPAPSPTQTQTQTETALPCGANGNGAGCGV